MLQGRIFCYDFHSKALVLKTQPDGKNYGETVLINTRNASDIVAVENAPALTKEEIKREFSAGDISKLE